LAVNKSPLLISVVGTSGSGKTSTIEYLTAHLTKLGFRVGVAKHVHLEGFTIDTEGKDTWKHARAGARIVVAASPDELAAIKKTAHEAKFKEIKRILLSEDLDLIFLEGFSKATARRQRVYKIVEAKDARDLKYTLARTHAPILAITGHVTESKRIRNSPARLLNVQRESPLITPIVRRLPPRRGRRPVWSSRP